MCSLLLHLTIENVRSRKHLLNPQNINKIEAIGILGVKSNDKNTIKL